MAETVQDENKEELEIENTADVEIETLTLPIIIDTFVHKVLDIEECAKEFITIAREQYSKNAKRLELELKEADEALAGSEPNTAGLKSIRKTMKEIKRHNQSDLAATLEKSLFINLFSIFDTFIGDLIFVLYNNKPELYNSMNNEIRLSEALQYSSLEELKSVVLDKEIESIRRKSYVEQFKELEKIFSIKLTKFEQWPNFIESAQRRNLFTHCDGIVSEQYLEICNTIGYKNKDNTEIGDKLEIGSDYFFRSCHRITEVAVMLAHTLWRKVLPDELEKADEHLHLLVFNFLEMDHWNNAILLSKFGLSLPNISSDKYDRINTINYAIALKALGKDDAAKNVLNKKDWSASTYDFRLAYSILTDDFEKAKSLMVQVGPKGDLIEEISYHEWPLFREFRDSEEFTEGYVQVYGYKYTDKLSAIVKEENSIVEDLEEVI